MALPEEAKFETKLSDEVALYDVSHILPKGPGRYREREPGAIRVAFAHKSGADGPDGFKGALAMARFCTNAEWGRGWPGAPYTTWTSKVPDVDAKDRMVVYRCQPDDVRSFHTGGAANGIGLAHAMQGAYDGQWDLMASGRPKVEVEPSHEAMVCWQALWIWTVDRYNLDPETGISGHFEAKRYGAKKNKPVCPGDFLRQWIVDFRGKAADTVSTDTLPEIPAVEDGEWNVLCPAPLYLQAALKLVGFNPGPLDGLWGVRSRAALERFQHAEGLEADGWYGVRTATRLLKQLRRRNLAEAVAFYARVDRMVSSG